MGRPLPEMKKPHPIRFPSQEEVYEFLFQPLSSLTLSRHSLIPMLVTLNPVIVAECGGGDSLNAMISGLRSTSPPSHPDLLLLRI